MSGESEADVAEVQEESVQELAQEDVHDEEGVHADEDAHAHAQAHVEAGEHEHAQEQVDAHEAGEAKPDAAPKEDVRTEEALPEEPREAAAGVEEAPKQEEPIASAVEEAPKEEPAPEPVPVTIASVVPDHGPLAGGATVVIQGTGFAEGCSVSIGGTAANTTRESETRLVVETPPRDRKGLAEVRVVNSDERFAVYEDDYRYDAAPSIVGTQPACVSIEGGEVLTILGGELAQGCIVRIGGEVVPSSWVHAGRLEAVTKKRDAGEADVAVDNPDGQRAVRERAVRFAAPPRIQELDPASVRTTGGAQVKVVGSGFEDGAVVLVAGERVETRFVSATELGFVAPPHGVPETRDVAVVNPTGLAHELRRALAYAKAPPRIDGVTPESGPNAGGTTLVVRGQDFDEGAGVFVCGIAAKVTSAKGDELQVVTPPVARDGLVEVRVVNRDDQAHALANAFRYLAPLPPPRLASLAPARGSQAGGLEVSLYGEDLAEGLTVRFGGVPAARVQFLTHREIRATTPPFSGYGEVTVEVQNPDGASATLENAFTYEPKPAPEIAGITPTSGPTTGGTKVTMEGKNFTREATVYVGREYPKDFVWKSASEIQIVTAARKQAGVVDVEVVVPGAPRAVMKNGFRYDAVPAPVITSVSPNAGTPGGGTEMTISGKNFLKDTAVLVDGKAPKAVKLVDASTLEFKTPPGEPGKMVDVVVRNPDGKEAVQKRAFLYDPRYRG